MNGSERSNLSSVNIKDPCHSMTLRYIYISKLILLLNYYIYCRHHMPEWGFPPPLPNTTQYVAAIFSISHTMLVAFVNTKQSVCVCVQLGLSSSVSLFAVFTQLSLTVVLPLVVGQAVRFLCRDRLHMHTLPFGAISRCVLPTMHPALWGYQQMCITWVFLLWKLLFEAK